MRYAFILIPVIALSGCAAVWGQAYKVEVANSSRVIINYDPSLTDVGSLLNVAQKNCSAYGKEAVPDKILPSELGLREAWFRCKGSPETHPNVTYSQGAQI